jgi:outer membrane lipase/esterase
MKRKMSGSTDGDNLSLSLLGGYEFQSGSVAHGPWAGVQLQWIDVDGFSEGGGSSALRFGSQKRNSTVGSVGYRATMDAGSYMPFGSVSWNHEFRDEDRDVTASLTSMAASSFAMPGVKAKRDWATLSGGVSVRVAPSATAILSASAEVGRGDVTNYGLHAGINFQF